MSISWKRICVTAENHLLDRGESEARTVSIAITGDAESLKREFTHLASLLRMLGDLFTAICDGDLSISFASVPAFSNTWNRDFTFRLDNSSRPRSGLSEAGTKSGERFRRTRSTLLRVKWLCTSLRCGTRYCARPTSRPERREERGYDRIPNQSFKVSRRLLTSRAQYI